MNYTNSKVYKIVCRKSGLVYIGSSTNPYLSRRLGQHTYDYKRYLQQKCNYRTSFEIIKENDYYIELLESCCCNSYDELAKKERYYIENNVCINKNIPSRTNAERQRNYIKRKYLNNINDGEQ